MAVAVAILALASALALAAALGVVLLRERRAARKVWAALVRMDAPLTFGSSLGAVANAVDRLADRTASDAARDELARRRLLAVLAVLPQGIVVYDPAGSIAFRNEAADGYLTAGRSGVLVEGAISELAAVVAASDPAPRGAPAVRPSRSIELVGPARRTLVLRAEPLVVGGSDRLGVLIAIEDVTDRLRLEAVRRDFVANIGHELKTPVGAIGLLAETLAAEDDPEVARRLAERVMTEAFRVGRTIDDLLVLSQIESDEADRARLREEVGIRDAVSEAVDRVLPAAEHQRVRIEVEDVPSRLVVIGDRRQLVSATYNLLENAVKYSDPGSAVHVAVRTDGRWIDLSVEDHGIGIPARDLERVFERFYRVDRARSRETGGTGLGLAIVRHVASNHAGEVRVASVEGVGSTFTLRLPVGAGPVAVTSEAG
jgi:two-component system sensor histidine kinase SenX3